MIIVNGKRYEGKSVSVVNDAVYVDGKLMTKAVPDNRGVLAVHVSGDLADVYSDVGITCSDVQGNVMSKGSVQADSIEGNVIAGGSVNCDDIGNNVYAKGSVNCDDIGGSIRAGGSVNHS